MVRRQVTTIAAMALAAVAALAFGPFSEPTPPSDAIAAVGHADLGTLRTAFDSWREAYERRGGSFEVVRLNLGYSAAVSMAPTAAHGSTALNLVNGELDFSASRLKPGGYALWLIDNGDEPGNSIRPENTDRFLRVGEFTTDNAGQGALRTRLDREQLRGFSIDSLALTVADHAPTDGVVISGGADLLQKLYYNSQFWSLAGLGEAGKPAEPRTQPFDFLLPKLARADGASDLSAVLGAQVAQGRQLFHNETFGGNGRTCGTCHRADNNFTLDPNYIAKLPNSDPLFVAETNPALRGLENPSLLRKYGLILTSVDGLDHAPIFRSVPHLLAMGTSIVSESTDPAKLAPHTVFKAGEFAADNAFTNATGWGGDGAPGSGSLNEFALGAVFQHFPKTLNRNVDAKDAIPDDFRMPSAAELDAIEAYTLSLGRSKDYPLWKMTFLDPLTQAGKTLFDTKENPCSNGGEQTGGPPASVVVCSDGGNVVQGQTANCNGCHQHAGARSSTTFANPSRNTGIENLKINPARLVYPELAQDAGFGREATSCGPNGDSCFGDGRFNTPTLIEAADTAPYFHNNSVTTLEESIGAYNSDAFNFSPGAFTSKGHDRRVKLDASQIVAVASFLRAINAVDNIRTANRLDSQARQLVNNASARDLANLAREETDDAIAVLRNGVHGAYGKALARLDEARLRETLALIAPAKPLRDAMLGQAIARRNAALALLATCDESAPRPPAVGSSPAGFVFSCAELNAR